ncbi:MAG: TolC family protein, partial [Proteobacteria bacterium]|nr:TolC family protein [Pseudomonadota bacterium]
MQRPVGPRWDLDALTLAALYERPDMPIAAAQVEVAEAGEVTAREWPNPVFSLAPTYNTTTVIPSPWTVGPFISTLIQTAGKRPALAARARARAAAAREGLAVTAWQVRGQVRTALLDLWSARRRLALSRRNQLLARDYETVLAQRYQAGLISSPTLTNAQLTENQAALNLASDERTERLAWAGLAAAIGVPEGAVEGIALDFSGFDHIRPPRNLTTLRRAALTQRPDLVQAGARYAAAQAALRLAVANQYPDLNIGPGYHFDQGDNKFILGISLPLPVFNQNQGPIAAARAARHLA